MGKKEHVAWGAEGSGCGGFLSMKDACSWHLMQSPESTRAPSSGKNKAGLTIETWGETPPCLRKPSLTRPQTSCCCGDQCHPGWVLGASGAPGRSLGATGASTRRGPGRSVPGSGPHLTRTE